MSKYQILMDSIRNPINKSTLGQARFTIWNALIASRNQIKNFETL